MKILGIETSCDETAVALYDGDIETGQGGILAEKIASQIQSHARFGGVVPEVASREHLQVLPGMVQEVMQDADLVWADIDMLAVTAGPGLMGALLVGASYAQAVGLCNHIPVQPVHHMEGHLLAPGLSGELPAFPFMALLVSGGHTLLVRVDAVGVYSIVGQTLDDAVGECFDKTARVLGLPYPGGPEISRLAQGGDAKRFKLPRPMLHKKGLDFSFSGLKTAVMYAARDAGVMDAALKSDMAAGIEMAISDVLVAKSMRACAEQGVPRLLIAGGVAANACLRRELLKESQRMDVELVLPDLSYCTDNASMIAYAGFMYACTGRKQDGGWDVRPRWQLEELS